MGEAAKAQVMMLLGEDDLKRIVGEALRAELANREAPGGGAKYLTAKQVGSLVGVTPKTVQKWAERDGLPAIRIGRECRFRPEDVKEWLGERATKPGGHVTKHMDRLRKL
jgi:excisionase family DNA binding protein